MVYTKKIDRDMLVVVASDLLEQEGIEAVSMRRLALALDVQVSSLYHHFAEKSALLTAVAEKGISSLAAELEQARVGIQSDVHQQLRSLAMAYREWALLHPQLYLLLFAGGLMKEGSSALSSPIQAIVGHFVGEHKTAAAAQAIWAFVHGFVMLELAGQMRQSTPAQDFLLGLQLLQQGMDSSRQDKSSMP